jgi:hypothetical protein
MTFILNQLKDSLTTILGLVAMAHNGNGYIRIDPQALPISIEKPPSGYVCDYEILPRKYIKKSSFKVCSSKDVPGKTLLISLRERKALQLFDAPLTNFVEKDGVAYFTLYNKSLSLPSGSSRYISYEVSNLYTWDPRRQSTPQLVTIYQDSVYPSYSLDVGIGGLYLCKGELDQNCFSVSRQLNLVSFSGSGTSKKVYTPQSYIENRILSQSREPVLHNIDGRITWFLHDTLLLSLFRHSSLNPPKEYQSSLYLDHGDNRYLYDSYMSIFCSLGDKAAMHFASTRYTKSSTPKLFALHLSRFVQLLDYGHQLHTQKCAHLKSYLAKNLSSLSATVEEVRTGPVNLPLFLFSKPDSEFWSKGMVLPTNYASSFCEAVFTLEIKKWKPRCAELAKYIVLARKSGKDNYYPSVLHVRRSIPSLFSFGPSGIQVVNPTTPQSYQRIDSSFLMIASPHYLDASREIVQRNYIYDYLNALIHSADQMRLCTLAKYQLDHSSVPALTVYLSSFFPDCSVS